LSSEIGIGYDPEICSEPLSGQRQRREETLDIVLCEMGHYVSLTAINLASRAPRKSED
jgi:hypothetical protein